MPVINMMTGMDASESDGAAEGAARAHLASRYTPSVSGRTLSPAAAVAAVASALEDGGHVDGEDLRAALRLLEPAHQEARISEFTVLDRARTDLTWGEIGTLTGIGDRRLAHQRYTRLRTRLLAAGLIEADEQPPATHDHKESK